MIHKSFIDLFEAAVDEFDEAAELFLSEIVKKLDIHK